eukprot:Unigene5122_Nuclearia_a/m.15720 Unigene5122_Nuclearia_a/g.15720  ORF Unigene5122_Nuclearia_a/g.15720 Unigene5122_Nuclearia_a/m.15720 type:complete len:226 (-) Unigene5122_Nuclearia_a:95-772(-)
MTLRFLRTTAPALGVDTSQEIKLFDNIREREKFENQADLYAIIVTTEYLEKAYVRDTVAAAEYTPACSKLIAQFKTSQNLNREQVPSIPEFMQRYHLSAPAAVTRLLMTGVPATVEHSVTQTGERSQNEKYVAETTQHFITLMDSLRLNLAAVDQIHPLLSDLMNSLNHVSSLPADFEGKTKVKQWLVQLNQMRASDELNADQVRQLLFDLENAHNAFYRSLSQK